MASVRLRLTRIMFDGKSAMLITQPEGQATQEAIQKMMVPLVAALGLKPEQVLVMPPDVDVDTYNMPC